MFQDVGEVDEDVDPHAAAGRFSAGQVQLVAGTVDQHHPGAPVGRIPLLRLVEDRLDDLLAVGGDRAGQPLGLRVGTEPAAALAAAALGSGGGDTDDVVGAAGGRFGVVDHSQGGHPFASLLFAAGQPGAIRPRPFRLGCLQGRLAQRSGRTTTPLPSTDTTSTVASVDGWGVMAWENASMSAAAATVSSSTCRLPTTCPQRRPIASVAWSNEPRTVTVPKMVASSRWWPVSTARRVTPSAPVTAAGWAATASSSRSRRNSRWSWNSCRSSSRPRSSSSSSSSARPSLAAGSASSSTIRASNTLREAANGSVVAAAQGCIGSPVGVQEAGGVDAATLRPPPATIDASRRSTR